MRKKKAMHAVILCLYLILFFCQIFFYQNADFGKFLTKQYAYCMLAFCGLLCVHLALYIVLPRERFWIQNAAKVIIAVVTVLQLFPVTDWMIWSGASFYLFETRYPINMLGVVVHLVFLLFGMFLLKTTLVTDKKGG